MGKPVFGSRPSQAAAPLELPGDRLWGGPRRARHPEPAGGPSVPGLWSSLAQDSALEDR